MKHVTLLETSDILKMRDGGTITLYTGEGETVIGLAPDPDVVTTVSTDLPVCDLCGASTGMNGKPFKSPAALAVHRRLAHPSGKKAKRR